jgi:hypothetical protein
LQEEHDRKGDGKEDEADAREVEAVGVDGGHDGEQQQGYKPEEVAVAPESAAPGGLEDRPPLEGVEIFGGDLVVDLQRVPPIEVLDYLASPFQAAGRAGKECNQLQQRMRPSASYRIFTTNGSSSSRPPTFGNCKA